MEKIISSSHIWLFGMKSTAAEPLTLRGKDFTKRELRIIQKCVTTHYEKGRTFISIKVCEKLEWKQPNGWLKDRACRDVLVKLDEMKLIRLPESKKYLKKEKNKKEEKKVQFDFEVETMPSKIELKFSKGNSDEELWNTVVNQYHYLGHKVTVGRCIKYLIYGDSQLIGAIAFSSPANRLSLRDDLLETHFGFTVDDTKTYVINNTRFLILPHVKVKNLASTILSQASLSILKDWEKYYSVKPALVETFVQISKFEGTCYKAANWKYIGDTRGYSKKGNDYVENKEPKKIFLYGLTKAARKQLSKIS